MIDLESSKTKQNENKLTILLTLARICVQLCPPPGMKLIASSAASQGCALYNYYKDLLTPQQVAAKAGLEFVPIFRLVLQCFFVINSLLQLILT